MERSATPKVSQIQQQRAGGGAKEAHPNQEAANAANSTNGLLGWMKSALTLPTAGVTGERSRKSSTSTGLAGLVGMGATPVPLSPTGLTFSSSSDEYPIRHLPAQDDGATHSNRSSISLDSNNTSGEESAAEELYHPFKPRDQSAASTSPKVKTPLKVVKPTARRDVTTKLNDSDDLPEKPILLDSPLSRGDKSLQDDRQRHSLVLDESLTGQCVVDHTLSSNPPSVILTPPEDASGFDSLSSRLGQEDYEYDDDHESIQGDGSRELDGVEYMEGEGPSREQVAIGSSAAFQREKFNRSTSSSSSKKRRGYSHSEGGEGYGDDSLDAARQEWDESRSKTPLASAAAWARKQQTDPNQPPLPELVTALRADADARKASLSEKTPVVGSSGKVFPSNFPEKPTRKKSSAGRRAATEGVGTTVNSEVPLSIPAPQRPARKGLFGRRDRSSSEASFSANESSVLDDTDGMEELSATVSISSSSKGSSNRNSASFWNFGKRNSGIKPPTPSRTPRPGDVSIANQNKDSSSESEASGGEVSEDEAEVRREESAKRGRNGSEGSIKSFNDAMKDFKSSKGVSAARRLVKTRYKGKSSKDRNFGRLFLVQELPLGINQFGEDEHSISRRSSIISNTGSGNGGDQGGRNSMDSRNSSDGRKSGDSVLKRGSMHHTDSSLSLSSDVSSSSTVASNMSSTASSNGAQTQRKKKATWAMKFSLDGMYLAVAGQDSIVRIFQVLSSPEARKNEFESQNSDGLNPLGIGTANKGGSNPSLASKDTSSSNGGSIGKNKNKRNSGFGPSPAQGIAPVFSSTPIREYRGHTSDVLDLSWSKNNFLLSSSMDKTAKLWHVSRNECLCTFGHLDFVTSACFHPRDDRFFISGSLDGKLRLWNIPNKTVQASTEVPGLITACAFTQSGETACVGTFAGAALFYETERLQYTTSIAVRSSSGKNARGRKITGIEAVPSAIKGQERVLITSNDSRIRVYDLRDKSHIKYKASGAYQNRTSQIRATLSQDGQFIIAGSEDAGVYIWDAIKEGPNSNASSSKKKKSESKSQSGSKNSKSEAGAGGGGGGGYESWTAASTTVTCALMAPLKSHSYLTASEDPMQMKAEMLEAGTVSSNTTNALSALSLASALSAAMPAPLRPGGPTSTPSPAFDARFNRIVCTADDSSVVRIWRSDSHGVL